MSNERFVNYDNFIRQDSRQSLGLVSHNLIYKIETRPWGDPRVHVGNASMCRTQVVDFRVCTRGEIEYILLYEIREKERD